MPAPGPNLFVVSGLADSAKFGACKLASEELFYRGTQGSGTIFFTSCNMRCAFCQNGDISTGKDNSEETDPNYQGYI